MVRFLTWLLSRFTCRHQWRFVRTVDEQDLRSGMKHTTDVYVCRRCDAVEHRENR